MAIDRQKRDLYLFAKDNKLTDAQIDTVLAAHQNGMAYSACIDLIRVLAIEPLKEVSE